MTITTHGYAAIFKPTHPMANRNGYVYEHRLVMAEVIGRMLNKLDHVHHRDGNKLNNAIDNLELMFDTAHRVKHRKNRVMLRMPGEPNPEVKCACGCQETFYQYDQTGRPRRFVSGHNKNAANTLGVKNPKKGKYHGTRN